MSARLWPHSEMRIWAPFYLKPEDIRCLGLGAIWNFSKVTGLPRFDMEQKGPIKSRPMCVGAERLRTQMQINQSSINQYPILAMRAYGGEEL